MSSFVLLGRYIHNVQYMHEYRMCVCVSLDVLPHCHHLSSPVRVFQVKKIAPQVEHAARIVLENPDNEVRPSM